MRAFEFVTPEKQRVDSMKKHAQAAQKRAKQAALQLKLRKTQQQLANVNSTKK